MDGTASLTDLSFIAEETLDSSSKTRDGSSSRICSRTSDSFSTEADNRSNKSSSATMGNSSSSGSSVESSSADSDPHDSVNKNSCCIGNSSSCCISRSCRTPSSSSDVAFSANRRKVYNSTTRSRVSSRVSMYILVLVQCWSVVVLLLLFQQHQRMRKGRTQDQSQRRQQQNASKIFLKGKEAWPSAVQLHFLRQLQQQTGTSKCVSCGSAETQKNGERKSGKREEGADVSQVQDEREEDVQEDIQEERDILEPDSGEEEEEEYLLPLEANLIEEENEDMEEEDEAADSDSESATAHFSSCRRLKRKVCGLLPEEQQLFCDFRDKFRYTQQDIRMHVDNLSSTIASYKRDVTSFAKHIFHGAFTKSISAINQAASKGKSKTRNRNNV